MRGRYPATVCLVLRQHGGKGEIVEFFETSLRGGFQKPILTEFRGNELKAAYHPKAREQGKFSQLYGACVETLPFLCNSSRWVSPILGNPYLYAGGQLADKTRQESNIRFSSPIRGFVHWMHGYARSCRLRIGMIFAESPLPLTRLRAITAPTSCLLPAEIQAAIAAFPHGLAAETKEKEEKVESVAKSLATSFAVASLVATSSIS